MAEPDEKISKLDNDEELQKLRERIDPEEVQWASGGQRGVSKESILRQGMYERLDARSNKDHESRKLPQAIGQDGKAKMRNVQSIKDETLRSSQRPQPIEQYTIELDDCLRFLPSTLSFAKLQSDDRTATGVSLLLEAIYEAQTLPYSSIEIEEAWASISEEDKNRIRMGFNVARWELVVSRALANGLPRSINDLGPEARAAADEAGLDTKSLARAKKFRIGSLKGYGNAIVSEVAVEIIKAYMEYDDERG